MKFESVVTFLFFTNIYSISNGAPGDRRKSEKKKEEVNNINAERSVNSSDEMQEPEEDTRSLEHSQDVWMWEDEEEIPSFEESSADRTEDLNECIHSLVQHLAKCEITRSEITDASRSYQVSRDQWIQDYDKYMGSMKQSLANLQKRLTGNFFVDGKAAECGSSSTAAAANLPKEKRKRQKCRNTATGSNEGTSNDPDNEEKKKKKKQEVPKTRY